MLTLIRSTVFNLVMPMSAILTVMVFWFSLFNREWALIVGRAWNRAMLGSLKLICGLDHQILHPERIPDQAVLIAAKHQSMWETMALAIILPKPCIILKKELFNIPVFGWFCRSCGFIGIDREAGSAAMREMLTQAKARAAEGFQIVIFPEGTRQKPGTSSRYHPGVAGLYSALKIPCIPVAHNAGLFWQYPSVVKKAGRITMSFEEPIEPGLKRKAFMEKLETAIETTSLHLAGMVPVPSAEQAGARSEPEEKAVYDSSHLGDHQP